MTIKLAIDAMGGDQAPKGVVLGADLALARNKNVSCTLYGDQAQIEPLVADLCKHSDRIHIRHTDEHVPDNMPPTVAIRTLKKSSMRLAIQSVAKGENDAVVSSGNTGAYMALSKLMLKTLQGIDRPAIAAPIPNPLGRSLMLDLGANLDCTSDNYIQFALMGEVFAREVLGIENPSVGLLNIGEEDIKGHVTLKESAAFLKRGTSIQNFHGFIEGTDVLKGTVDVIVTDGFSGNISLKTAESTFRAFKQTMADEMRSSLRGKIAYFVMKPILGRIAKKFDPRNNNGAPFLGLNGVSVKSHGNSDHIGFANAINVAIQMVDHNVNQLIQDGLDKWYQAETE